MSCNTQMHFTCLTGQQHDFDTTLFFPLHYPSLNYILPESNMSSLPITLVGGTGLTGSAALLALLQSPSAVQLTTITRKDAPSPIQAFTNGSTTYINRPFSNLSDAIGSSEGVGPSGGVYISCLGTTRGAAGGFEKQKEIDLYLNRDLVTKAKADGAKTVSYPIQMMS